MPDVYGSSTGQTYVENKPVKDSTLDCTGSVGPVSSLPMVFRFEELAVSFIPSGTASTFARFSSNPTSTLPYRNLVLSTKGKSGIGECVDVDEEEEEEDGE